MRSPGIVSKVGMSKVSFEFKARSVTSPKPFDAPRSATLLSRKLTSFSLDQAGKAVTGIFSRYMVVDILFQMNVRIELEISSPA